VKGAGGPKTAGLAWEGINHGSMPRNGGIICRQMDYWTFRRQTAVPDCRSANHHRYLVPGRRFPPPRLCPIHLNPCSFYCLSLVCFVIGLIQLKINPV